MEHELYSIGDEVKSRQLLSLLEYGEDVCKVCEASSNENKKMKPTHCPGRPLTWDEEELVHFDLLDFAEDKWLLDDDVYYSFWIRILKLIHKSKGKKFKAPVCNIEIIPEYPLEDWYEYYSLGYTPFEAYKQNKKNKKLIKRGVENAGTT